MKLPKHEIIRRKGMAKDYVNNLWKGRPIENYTNVWIPWMKKYYGGGCTKMHFNLGCAMSGDNRETLAAILGKPSFHYRGYKDFHAWYVSLPTCDFIILTAAEKGTVYEVVTSGTLLLPPDPQAVLNFMDAIAKEMLRVKLLLDNY